MTLYYPVQDKTTTRPVYTRNYYTENNKQKNIIYLSKTKESIRVYTCIGYVYMSNNMKKYGFRAWPLYECGVLQGSARTLNLYCFEVAPFPPGSASTGSLCQSRGPQGRTYQVEPLTFLDQLFKINCVVS